MSTEYKPSLQYQSSTQVKPLSALLPSLSSTSPISPVPQHTHSTTSPLNSVKPIADISATPTPQTVHAVPAQEYFATTAAKVLHQFAHLAMVVLK